MAIKKKRSQNMKQNHDKNRIKSTLILATTRQMCPLAHLTDRSINSSSQHSLKTLLLANVSLTQCTALPHLAVLPLRAKGRTSCRTTGNKPKQLRHRHTKHPCLKQPLHSPLPHITVPFTASGHNTGKHGLLAAALT